MATIHRESGYRVIIWSNDHRPPHVHVFTADGEAVIEIESLALIEVVGMRGREGRRAVAIVAAHQKHFLSEWRRIHGD